MVSWPGPCASVVSSALVGFTLEFASAAFSAELFFVAAAVSLDALLSAAEDAVSLAVVSLAVVSEAAVSVAVVS